MVQHADGALSGKKAIITGAASGIGEAIAKAYLAEGAEVLGVDLPSAKWRTSSDDRSGLNRLAIDITEAKAPHVIVAAATELLGGADILVNNAGIAPIASAETTTDETWNKVMQINVTAIFRLTREAIPLLKKSKAGRIINTGSIMSEMAGPEAIAYTTSKHAVAGMTKSMAADLGKYGIAANYLQPGSVVTPLVEAHMQDKAFVDYWKHKTPLGRLGQPDDIAGVAVFLASDAAKYISGAGIKIDGGAAMNV